MSSGENTGRQEAQTPSRAKSRRSTIRWDRDRAYHPKKTEKVVRSRSPRPSRSRSMVISYARDLVSGSSSEDENSDREKRRKKKPKKDNRGPVVTEKLKRDSVPETAIPDEVQKMKALKRSPKKTPKKDNGGPQLKNTKLMGYFAPNTSITENEDPSPSVKRSRRLQISRELEADLDQNAESKPPPATRSWSTADMASLIASMNEPVFEVKNEIDDGPSTVTEAPASHLIKKEKPPDALLNPPSATNAGPIQDVDKPLKKEVVDDPSTVTKAPAPLQIKEESPPVTHLEPSSVTEAPAPLPVEEELPAVAHPEPLSSPIADTTTQLEAIDEPVIPVENEIVDRPPEVSQPPPSPSLRLKPVNISLHVSKSCRIGPLFDETRLRSVPPHNSLPYPEEITRIVQNLIRCAHRPRDLFNFLRDDASGQPFSIVMFFDRVNGKLECKKIPVSDGVNSARTWLSEFLESVGCCKNLFVLDFIADNFVCRHCFAMNQEEKGTVESELKEATVVVDPRAEDTDVACQVAMKDEEEKERKEAEKKRREDEEKLKEEEELKRVEEEERKEAEDEKQKNEEEENTKTKMHLDAERIREEEEGKQLEQQEAAPEEDLGLDSSVVDEALVDSQNYDFQYQPADFDGYFVNETSMEDGDVLVDVENCEEELIEDDEDDQMEETHLEEGQQETSREQTSEKEAYSNLPTSLIDPQMSASKIPTQKEVPRQDELQQTETAPAELGLDKNECYSTLSAFFFYLFEIPSERTDLRPDIGEIDTSEFSDASLKQCVRVSRFIGRGKKEIWRLGDESPMDSRRLKTITAHRCLKVSALDVDSTMLHMWRSLLLHCPSCVSVDSWPPAMEKMKRFVANEEEKWKVRRDEEEAEKLKEWYLKCVSFFLHFFKIPNERNYLRPDIKNVFLTDSTFKQFVRVRVFVSDKKEMWQFGVEDAMDSWRLKAIKRHCCPGVRTELNVNGTMLELWLSLLLHCPKCISMSSWNLATEKLLRFTREEQEAWKARQQNDVDTSLQEEDVVVEDIQMTEFEIAPLGIQKVLQMQKEKRMKMEEEKRQADEECYRNLNSFFLYLFKIPDERSELRPELRNIISSDSPDIPLKHQVRASVLFKEGREMWKLGDEEPMDSSVLKRITSHSCPRVRFGLKIDGTMLELWRGLLLRCPRCVTSSSWLKALEKIESFVREEEEKWKKRLLVKPSVPTAPRLWGTPAQSRAIFHIPTISRTVRTSSHLRIDRKANSLLKGISSIPQSKPDVLVPKQKSSLNAQKSRSKTDRMMEKNKTQAKEIENPYVPITPTSSADENSILTENSPLNTRPQRSCQSIYRRSFTDRPQNEITKSSAPTAPTKQRHLTRAISQKPTVPVKIRALTTSSHSRIHKSISVPPKMKPIAKIPKLNPVVPITLTPPVDDESQDDEDRIIQEDSSPNSRPPRSCQSIYRKNFTDQLRKAVWEVDRNRYEGHRMIQKERLKMEKKLENRRRQAEMRKKGEERKMTTLERRRRQEEQKREMRRENREAMKGQKKVKAINGSQRIQKERRETKLKEMQREESEEANMVESEEEVKEELEEMEANESEKNASVELKKEYFLNLNAFFLYFFKQPGGETEHRPDIGNPVVKNSLDWAYKHLVRSDVHFEGQREIWQLGDQNPMDSSVLKNALRTHRCSVYPSELYIQDTMLLMWYSVLLHCPQCVSLECLEKAVKKVTEFIDAECKERYH